jgi:hypothetical protein
MNFDLPTIGGIVRRLASKLVPGWTVECALATREESAEGWLAKVDAHPERTMARIVVAPHPPDEDYEETIAHELTHVMLSPLAQLVKRSSASVMLEEQIVERLGKLLAGAPDKFRRAVVSAVSNPRADSPVVRFRISALATRRRINERKRSMANPKKLAELAMKAGELGAREDVPEDVRALLAEFVAEMAGGGDDAGPASTPMREDDPGKDAPQMREDEMPEAMRSQYRLMVRTTAASFETMKRIAIHELRTVDRLDLSPVIETRLRKARTPEDFEERVSLVRDTLSNTETRKRSGVKSDASDVNGAPSLESMTAEGIPDPVARHVRAEYARGKAFGEEALKASARFRKKVAHG